MHVEPRNGASIDRIYLHTDEGGETENGAQALYDNTLSKQDGGYHVGVDDLHTVRYADDHDIVWGEGGDNLHCLSIVIKGGANQSAVQWADPYSKAAIERAAQQVAEWCRTYNIPVVHVRPGAPSQAPTDRGIAEHADDHNPASQGHTDPGSNFPIDAFVARVEAINIGILNTLIFFEWVKEINQSPIHPGESSWRVTALKEALNKIGEGPGNDHPFFGHNLADDVVKFKAKHGVDSTSPDFGSAALAALLKLL